jgi:glycosyltransferase involved in cell wall biosynthesis
LSVRVVLLTHHYPRWPGDYRGATLGALARALVRRGLSVRVVATSQERTADAELDGVPVRRVGVELTESLADQDTFAARLKRPGTWSALLRVREALKRAVRRELAAGADVVHAHSWLPAGLASPNGVPVVLTLQGREAMLLRSSRAARWLAGPLLRRAALITAPTQQAREVVQYISGRPIASGQIHPMPVDTKGHFWTRGGAGAVLVGRLDRGGRVGLALEAVAILASRGQKLALTIIGEGPDRLALERQAQILEVSSLVRFLGSMPPDQARPHLARADLMLVTARGDGGGSAVEALITGVPVVACWDSGAAVDLVPESGAGRLSLPAAEPLAESISSLLADPGRLAAGRLVGEAWRARLAPDHVAQVCESWYRDVIGR